MSTRLSILNDPPQVLEGPRLLHQLIRWERDPSACALDFTSHEKRQKYSYQELHACVASVAACIQRALQPSPDLTSRPQHVVPILLPQSPSLYISQLAILESGGAFCPINLDAPKERIKFVVSDVGAGIIITTPEFKDVATWENGPMVILVDEFPVVPMEATVSSSPSREAQPHELAYVMYTSGSSGLPKGVAVSHLAASQSLLAHERHIPPFKRFLQFAAPSFDVSVFEIFFPFTRTCTLVGCNRSQLLNDLPGMITELEIDAAELTPTVVGSLLQKRSNAPGLKLLLTIGEMLTRPIVEEFGGSDEKPNMLYGMYGPTEAAIHCTIYPAMEASAKPGNIGIPLDTVSTFVAAAATTADDAANLTFLPLGELGELVLGGPQLASGYLNRPDQNKAAFVEFEGRNYYRTGDKARQLENGTIEILGRMSAGQVKLRGQRIELGEIEEVVYKHPGIKTVSAVVLSGVLIVFALIGEQDIQVEDVMKTCAKWLPKFMVPSEIVLLQNFSYLPSGKVDKRKLEADYQKQREAQDDGSSASETFTEKTVRTVVQEILGPFPKNTRLAALGLDSLVAIRVASKLRSSGFNITTVAVLQADTLDSLTKYCEDSKSAPSQSPVETSVVLSEDATTALNGHAKDVEVTISCTPLQSAMLSETAMNPKAYRNWVELELPGLEDLGDVYAALRSLSDMNPILRTGFSESEDTNGYIQIVWRSLMDSQIEEVDHFEYEFDDVKDTSLNHPLRIQIMQSGSTTKLLIHLHHALYDAWSLELLLDDLDLLLQDLSPPSRPSFSNVIGGYQDGTLLGDAWSSKDYWKDHLLSLDPRPVPTFHSSKAPYTGLAIFRHLTTIQTSDMEAAAKRLSSSPQSLFQAAYALVLSSYLGSPDVCFGTVFSGRTLPIVGVEDIVGPCLATLPIRVDISASSDLQSLVQELNSINRKHLEHSTLPLREIKAAGGVHPRQPLFDTLLIWQQTLQSYDHTRKHVSLVDTVDNLEFNLTLEITPGVGNIELKANYEQSLFPQSQINMLLRQVEELVKVVLRPETTPLAEAPKFLDITLLSTENIKPEVKLRSGRLASPVEIIAAEDPRRPAIDFALSISPGSSQIQRMTYGELNAYANQIGHHLLAQDAFHEVVCICMEKCVDLYASILATAKVGAGYLPVTPDVPQDRLQYILREASVKVVIARSESRPLFQNLHNITVIYIDEVDLAKLSPLDVAPRFSEANLAYCVFTSGSTGTPKGVMVTQGNLLSNLDVLEDLYPASQNSRFLQSCSQAFDVSVFEIFFAWRVGGCLCSAVKDVLFRDIEQAIRELQVSHLSLTPTVAALIEPKNVPLVEFLVTAGEAVTQKVFNTWAGRGLWQGYGPSETTNICTIKPNVSLEDSINNIGPPLKNTSVFVLSPGPDFSLVPRGGEGEFCFGGSQVFRGYMDSKQNIGKIIDHAEFGRLYRSGDFGRLMPDGSLAFTGRKDDQVKVRGQRVELGEVTNVMLRSDHVQDCTTMVVGGKDGRPERLVCFWTSVSVNSADVECLSPDSTVLKALYDNLDSALPPYMIPSTLIPVSCLPSTPQGKIDRRLLIAQYNTLSVEYLDSTTRENQTSLDHQWTDLESDVAETLAQVTNVSVDQITPSTSFFNLGIDSVSAISFARSLRQRTQRNVEISDILKHPSVIRLAERMSASSQSNLSTDLASSSQVFDFGFDQDFVSKTIQSFAQAGRAVQNILPCTPLQEAMLSTAESSSLKLYNNLVVLDVVGNIERMKECWSEMARRHEILRTCFVRTDEPQFPYVQVILEEFPLKFSSIECSADETQKLIEENNERLPPQNEFEPPYSLELLHSPQNSKLLISMHHALYDGAALEILYEEVERLYHHETLLPPVSFEPFLRSMVSMDAVKADQFWEEALIGCSSTLLQSAHEPTAEESRQGGTRLQRTHSRSSLAWIEEQAKKHGTSILAACHAVWASIISESVQKTDICFGNVVSGRTASIEGVERLVAPCFNTIPARLQNIHKLSYLEAFRKLQTLNASSIPFQSTPLRRIQSKFSPDGTRLYDTLFILQQPPRVLDSSIWSVAEDDGAMDLPFVCEVVPHPGADALEIILHTHCSKVSAADAHHILNAFDTKLQEALENPRRQLLSTTTKEQIILAEASREATASNVSKTTETSKEMNAEEKEIRDVISKFTSVPLENIRRETSLFRLGLDSISTVQVAARLRKQGHKVLASDVLENPTIAQLCALITQNRSDDVSAEIPQYDFQSFDEKYRDIVCSKYNLNHNNIEAVRPCTAVQKGMIAQSLHSDGQEYVNSVLFELQPNESLPKLKEAWGSVQKEHQMLRTGFAAIEDSSNPFTMVTYGKATSHLPWFEGTGKEELSFADQLLQGPWSIKVFNDNDKTFLKLTAHHALYDAQSMSLILSDVADAYASKTILQRPLVTNLLGAILQSGHQDEDLKRDFWQSEGNKIVVNRFPDLTPLRVSTDTTSVREVISTASTEKLEDWCMRNGVTMQAAAQAAWARLLYFYIGETGTTFGMTLSGRSIAEDSDKISFPSIVTLPIRCDVVGTNTDLLSRSMNTNALLHKHQFTPLTSIQKWGGFPEGKIFDTLFAYQKTSLEEANATLPWKVVQEEATVDYAVSLEVQPAESGEIALRLTFKDSLIPAEQAELMLKQYDALLQDIVLNPQNPSDVAPEIGATLLSITPAKEPEIADTITLLHEYVERGAKQWPEKVALEFATCLELGNMKSTTWTYQELNCEANKVANMLLEQSILPGQLIAICFDKCAEASISIIGILKAGCAYVALDPNAPAERMKFIIEDSGAKLILTAGKPGQMITDTLDKQTILLDNPNSLEGFSANSPKLTRPITPEDTSYCLYTSGTTGTPKGCILSHSNAVQAMLAFQRLFSPHWTATSKWLQFASFHFDVSVLEQFWSWSVGICVVSAPRDLIFEDIPHAIRSLGVTHIDLTPSLARLLHPDDVPGLTKGVFITGGEQLKQEILDVWGEHACIYNGYGPTEATIGVTMYPRVPKNGKPSNIGPAFDNVGSFVLKPNTALPVLRGGVGELCVSGMLVGKGYLNRPDLTTERFPTLEGFNERVYRTGDLVRILHDGTFIFLGRADDQVKLRGQRLELGEINEVIKKSRSDLEEVVTLVLKHSTQQKEQLVTFLVLTNPIESPTDDGSLIAIVRNACKSRLPGYMVPTHFIPIKAMPLNANNKADAKQLAAMYNELTVDDLQRLSRSSEKDKPWTTAETDVLETIAAALQVDASALTRGTSIFELGMDSISIIGFSRTLKNAGYQNAKLSVIRSNTSISGLVQNLLSDKVGNPEKEAAYISASQEIALFSQKHMVSICNELGVDSTTVQKIAPCTPVQGGMIYRFLEHDEALYFNRFEFSLDNGINIENMFNAWDRVISQLEVLRTKFVPTDDGYAQVVLQTVEAIRQDDAAFSYDRFEKLEALKTPWAYAIGSGLMVLQIFHGLYDGNSLVMILQRLTTEYTKLEAASDTSKLSYGPSFHDALPYGPLAKMPGAKDFWTKHLSNWYPQEITNPSMRAATVEVNDILPNFEEFETLRKTLGVSHQALVQAAWMSVLQAQISPKLTATGIVTSGRTIDFEGADDVIGPLFNTIPFNLNIAPDMTWKKIISECHKFGLEMQDFQHTPLKDIQKWSPSGPGQPLFEALFVFQRPDSTEVDFAKSLWSEKPVAATADYPLAFEATANAVADGSSSLALKLVSNASVLSTDQAIETLKHIKLALSAMLKNQGEVGVFEHLDILPAISGHLPTYQPELTQNGSTSSNFQWTKEAELFRKEIASLANVAEADIHGDSSLFELGLDSIDVIKLSSRLRRHGVNIAVSTIIRSQTIQKMASAASIAGSQEPVTSSEGFVKKTSRQLAQYLKEQGTIPQNIPDDSVLPATPLQAGMVHLMTQSDYEMYFNVDIFKLHQNTDPKNLIAAVRKVVEASSVLSTYFLKIEDASIPANYAQITREDTSLQAFNSSFEEWDQSEVSQQSLNTLRAAAISRASKSQELFQVQYLTVGSNKYMVISIAHALYDGSSIQTFHNDIKRAYLGEQIQRIDFRPCLEEIFKSTTADAKKFWRSTLSNLPPAKFPRNAVPDTEQVYRATRQSNVPFSEIQNFCKESSVFIQTLGQTCWALVLAQLMGQLDVIFGTVLSCRDFPNADQVMFPLMNTVAVRSVLHGTLDEMLKYMQEMSNTTRQYQHFPLGEAQSIALSSRGKANDNTFFDTLFIYQGRHAATAGQSLYESEFSHADVDFPICVELEISEDGKLSWTTACKSSVRNKDETDQILTALDSVLQYVINSRTAPTFVAEADGISICGLPKFQKSDIDSKVLPDRPLKPIHSEWTDDELIIRKAFQEVSGVPEDSIHKDTTIFELGLDSISVHKLRKLLDTRGIKLSVSEILRSLNIDAMIQSLASTKSENLMDLDVDAVLSKVMASTDLTIAVKDLSQFGEIQRTMPVTAGQLYLLRGWQASHGAVFYPTFYYQLSSGAFDKQRLEEAWKVLLERHAILRTGFVESGSNILQVIFKEAHNNVTYGESKTDRLPLSGEPPVTLVVDENMSRMGLKIHHALYDAVSIEILLHELESLYQGQSLSTQDRSEDFRTFVAHSISPSSQALREKKWRSYLSCKDTLLPPSAQQSSTLGRTELFQPNLNVAGIKDFAKTKGITTDALFLTVMAEVFARRARSDIEAVFGIYLANRNSFDKLDFTTMAAPTLNLLPVHVRDALRSTSDAKKVATSIQEDLRQISSAEMSSASLQEIYEWTGVRVNCFVNILKDMGEADELVRRDGVQYFEPAPQPAIEDQTRSSPAPNLENVHISEAYLESLDVELKLQDNGQLGMGVFGPKSLVSTEEAEKMIEDFRSSLIKIIES